MQHIACSPNRYLPNPVPESAALIDSFCSVRRARARRQKIPRVWQLILHQVGQLCAACRQNAQSLCSPDAETGSYPEAARRRQAYDVCELDCNAQAPVCPLRCIRTHPRSMGGLDGPGRHARAMRPHRCRPPQGQSAARDARHPPS